MFLGSSLGTPQIIYASRTHSQLTQVMKELKRTNYSNMKAAILGSRDQLCLHPDLSQEQGYMKVIFSKIIYLKIVNMRRKPLNLIRMFCNKT